MLCDLRALGALALSSVLLAGCPGTDSSFDATGAPSEQGPPDAAEPVAFRLADYNVHDFFDDVQNGTETVSSTADYQAKLAKVGASIARLAADVVVLAEVENAHVLDDLAAGPLASAGYATRVLLPGNDQRGIQIGVLSKVPFDKVVSHVRDTFSSSAEPTVVHGYSRDCVELHLRVGGQHLALLGVHFRSKAQPDEPDKRLAEAEHTRAIADAISASDPTALVAILGDYNDEPGSPPLLAIAGKSPGAYADVAAEVTPASDAYTYVYQGARQLIDHQFASPRLAAMLDASSVTIPHDRASSDASDHSPIAATYEIR